MIRRTHFLLFFGGDPSIYFPGKEHFAFFGGGGRGVGVLEALTVCRHPIRRSSPVLRGSWCSPAFCCTRTRRNTRLQNRRVTAAEMAIEICSITKVFFFFSGQDMGFQLCGSERSDRIGFAGSMQTPRRSAQASTRLTTEPCQRTSTPPCCGQRLGIQTASGAAIWSGSSRPSGHLAMLMTASNNFLLQRDLFWLWLLCCCCFPPLCFFFFFFLSGRGGPFAGGVRLWTRIP